MSRGQYIHDVRTHTAKNPSHTMHRRLHIKILTLGVGKQRVWARESSGGIAGSRPGVRCNKGRSGGKERGKHGDLHVDWWSAGVKDDLNQLFWILCGCCILHNLLMVWCGWLSHHENPNQDLVDLGFVMARIANCGIYDTSYKLRLIIMLTRG